MEWLSKKDEYIPEEDKDKFINKSIASMFDALSDIKRNGENPSEGFYVINPYLKFFSTIMLILLISFSKNIMFLTLVIIFLTIALMQFKKDKMKKIIHMSLIMPVFSLTALIPSMIAGNIYGSLAIALKIFCSITSVSILSHSTKWSYITRALKFIYIPDIIILTVEITLRYIYILGEFSLEMLESLRLRSVGRNHGKYMSMSSMIGTLFMKSKYMGDELYAAMECRGFQGEYFCNLSLKMKLEDYIYLFLNLVLAAAFILFR